MAGEAVGFQKKVDRGAFAVTRTAHSGAHAQGFGNLLGGSKTESFLKSETYAAGSASARFPLRFTLILSQQPPTECLPDGQKNLHASLRKHTAYRLAENARFLLEKCLRGRGNARCGFRQTLPHPSFLEKCLGPGPSPEVRSARLHA